MHDLPPPQRNAIRDQVTLVESLTESMLEHIMFTTGETSFRVVGRYAPVSSHQIAAATSEDEYRFRQLADKWISETGPLSDPIRKFMDRSHLKIIAMGEKALPLILREVENKTGHWFIALDAISPVNPVRPEDQVSFESTRQAWLQWGKSEGLI